MRTTLAAVSALALITAASTSALAADPYAGSKDSLAVASVGAPVWTGFYIGANAGGAWEQLDSSFAYSSGPFSLGLNHTNAASGFFGGGQIGYNHQMGALLLGLETDFDYLAVDQTSNIITASLGKNSLALGTTLGGGFLTDVTGRIGYVSGPALFYAKGGWAYFGGTAGTSGISALGIKGVTDVTATNFSGWTLGGGIEYLLNSSWSIKGEYLHYDFGGFDFMPVASNSKIVINNDLTLDTVKVALSYHLGGTSYIPLK